MKLIVICLFIVGFVGGISIAEQGSELSPDQLATKVISGSGFDLLPDLNNTQQDELKEAIKLRMKTLKGRTDYALTALINLGDTNAMAEAIALRSRSPIFAVRSFGKTLQANCDRPDFLPFLAKELMIVETAEIRYAEDIPVEPISVNAARIMRHIVLKSAVFPASVKTWAENLDTQNRSALRGGMRTWWQTNQERIARGEYDKTAVVSSPEQVPRR